ncbi:PucR family transcriptional regulator ligand-binding domain-containing protein [Streptomyces sp. ACT015]|uniref:PucR family transcriptional regulator ligand-binding domain-containing protein n=1 Tax=Streptomyces sp. ACT015 TaxID=3134807 RepID=UPI003D16B7B9
MPELPVPPTPPVPLAALLAREDLALRRIAGPSDPGAVIHSAHTSEMADPYPYLLGGELLLTAGVHITDAAGSGTYFDDYVARIVAAGGAALGFGVAPVHDTVPRALVAACDAHGLPLLEVPPQTPFAAVARAVWQLMAQARLAELRRVTEAQQSLAAAASRPDPVPSVLHRLSRRLDGWAVLYGPEGTEIAASGRRPAAPVADALASLTAVVRPADAASPPAAPQGPPPPATGRAAPVQGRAAPASAVPARPASATDTAADGSRLAAYALGAGRGFVLGVAGARREPGDHTIASVAAVLLSLLTGEHQSGTGAARVSALVRVLLGADPAGVAPLLGTGPWRVVHGRPDPAPAGGRAGRANRDTARPDPVAAAALGAALGSALVDGGPEVVRVLVPGDREIVPQDGWTLGVSAEAAPGGWPDADAQAARALARAHATRVPLVGHGGPAGLGDLVPADAAREHARALLAPLAGSPALTETLRAWLSLHGSWDRTAVALSVHRNTVRQRVARSAALLGADLDDPDVRMELWFALRRDE